MGMLGALCVLPILSQVPSRSSSHPVTDSRCSPGREGGRGDEDGVAASSLTESPPSPKVVVDWGQPDPHVDGQESAKGDETRCKERTWCSTCLHCIAYLFTSALEILRTAEYYIAPYCRGWWWRATTFLRVGRGPIAAFARIAA